MHPRTRAIMIRAAAVENGEKTYYTGQPCSKGHVAARRTLDSLCLECYALRHKERQMNTEQVKRKNNLTKLHYWADQIKNLPPEDRALLELSTSESPKQNKLSATASIALTKTILATELLLRARSMNLDANRVAYQVIRLFDANDDWWHKMATRPVDEVLYAVMQHPENESDDDYFTRGSEYAAEHSLHSTRGTLGHVY